MSACSAVFMLQPELIDPRFVGFIVGPGAQSVLGNERAYQDLLVTNSGSLNWRPQSLARNWKPMPAAGRVNAFNDYPCLELSEPVFSRRAVDSLGSMLTPNGELLPLETAVGEYFLYVVLTKIDALDVPASWLERRQDDVPAVAIRYFAFDASRLVDASIFRIPEQPNCILVTDRFKDRVEQSGLNGFQFIKIWPLPEGSDLEADRAKRKRKTKTVKLAGEALVIRFTLGGEAPTVVEKKRAAAIEASLAAILKVDSLDAPYRGSIEVAEFADGEFRVFCTCPDAEQLAEFLKPWLDQVAWDGDIAIAKRFGNLYDTKAKEKRVQVRGDSPPSRHRK